MVDIVQVSSPHSDARPWSATSDRCFTGLVILATHGDVLGHECETRDVVRCGDGNLRNTIEISIAVHTSDEANQ